ncbi:MAG: sigma-70 family RNA polymerase sigma factor [Bacteroidota bacterium]|nr:sigma-70 family RNA polymerase sigma factor [Bacteroidota bacterium]
MFNYYKYTQDLKIAQLTDSDLIVRIKNGDEVAFELVFYKYKGKLYDFVRRSLSEEEDPESIVQEVFVKLWMNRAELDPQQSFNGYIYTIARNEIYGHLRKQLTRKKYQEERYKFVHLTERLVLFSLYEVFCIWILTLLQHLISYGEFSA